ncbi:putative RNA-directed DNA polymerase from transposon X-element [Trichonephila clavata]|uniref:Putative RNA-directed DNA polymerase from transposon X-element n=1 Tax=Trichonephila clavata TaxID=2740835 RepID=A0A8X6J872_TRICU|nr:putative RNA-directed DNA polymerase from transposon X-element [Trichonephila clavata]GFQ96015.1 putative RNA-directed DNA polymerase from transposon X-element [Trichonephila clavata]
MVYRHCRFVFGVCSSLFLLVASLNHLLERSSLEYTEIISKLKHSFYVDNCVSGVFTEQEVGNFISSAKNVLSKGCFNLRNWESNGIGPGVSKCTGDTDLLGIIWNLDRDTLRYSVINKIPQNKGNTTKRTILSFVQQFYDPIGILSAATLLPKIWLQEAWKTKLAWDDLLPPEVYNRFSRWLLEVACLSKIEIPRYIIVSGKSELHVFVDAPKNAYAACIFVRLVAWIKRFIVKCRKSPEDRNGGEISNSEFKNAEKILIRTVQRECFSEPKNVPIINVVKDNEGLLRVKTKITYRKDDPCFLTPILRPENCALTT